MKKTKLMRAALLLLVLTLITSCFVGGTFAKYTTSATGSDTARVAKWGFNSASTINLDNLFHSVYYKNDAETVKSSTNSTNVIAPGTAGEAKFNFTYNANNAAPEVAYTFTVSTAGSKCAQSIMDNKNIKWSLDGKLAPHVGEPSDANYAAEGSWAALLAAIEALDGNKTDNKYNPGELPTGFGKTDNEHIVAWQWAFETAPHGVVDAEQDAEDTEMGNANPLAEVTLKITVSATQVD